MSLARVGATAQWADSRHSIDTLTDAWIGWQASPSGASAWGTANRAIYIPVRIPRRVTIVQFGLACAATGADDIDMGLYYPDGTRIVSCGASASIAAAEVHVHDCTDTTVGPGMYYLAANCASGTKTVFALSDTQPLPVARGVLTEAVGATALPATATWAVNQTLTFIPVISAMLNTVVT